ncbi:unnamed protein product [Rhizophagus irregularis]|nr:unnamed protein product [Rhizophagus irregularis]
MLLPVPQSSTTSNSIILVVGEFAELFDLEIGKYPDGLDVLYDPTVTLSKRNLFQVCFKNNGYSICLIIISIIFCKFELEFTVPINIFAPSHMLALLTTGRTTRFGDRCWVFRNYCTSDIFSSSLTPLHSHNSISCRALPNDLKNCYQLLERTLCRSAIEEMKTIQRGGCAFRVLLKTPIHYVALLASAILLVVDLRIILNSLEDSGSGKKCLLATLSGLGWWFINWDPLNQL